MVIRAQRWINGFLLKSKGGCVNLDKAVAHLTNDSNGKVIMKILLVFGLTVTIGLLPAGALLADDTPVPREPVVVSDYQPAPAGSQIVIRPGDKEVFYEYRVNGKIVEIKVVPEVGPEYYLVPAEGGSWVQRQDPETVVPSWVLFRW